MADNPALVIDAKGLNTQPNELRVPAGSLAVAENVEVTRDGIVQVSPGFGDFSSNLPDFLPEQLIAVGGTLYLNLDSGLWYYDTVSGSWLRKRGNFGAKNPQPNALVYLNGHLYVGASTAIYDMNLATGTRSVIAGRFGVTGDTDGTGDAARFFQITGMATDGTSLFASISSRHVIRKIVIATGAVTTLAGTAGSPGTTDATGAAARFNTPIGLGVVGLNLYVCDSQNGSIRQIVISSGATTTFVGLTGTPGNLDGTGTAARLTGPWSVFASSNILYVATASATNSVRQVTVPGAAATTIISAVVGGSGVAAQGVALVGGSLYFTDFDTKTIRASVLGSGTASIFMGVNLSSGSADGNASTARFADPEALTTDGTNLFVAEAISCTIRKIYVQLPYVTTISGTPNQAAAGGDLGFIDGFVQGPP